jgi:hypothetical protein
MGGDRDEHMARREKEASGLRDIRVLKRKVPRSNRGYASTRSGCRRLPRTAADAFIPMLDTGGHMAIINDIAFTPDGRQLVSAGG